MQPWQPHTLNIDSANTLPRPHWEQMYEWCIKMSSVPVFVTKHLPNFVQFLVAVCFPRKSRTNIWGAGWLMTGAGDHSTHLYPHCALDPPGVWSPIVHSHSSHTRWPCPRSGAQNTGLWLVVTDHLTRTLASDWSVPAHYRLWHLRSEVSRDGDLLLVQLHRVRRQEHRGGPHPLHHGHDGGEDWQPAQADHPGAQTSESMLVSNQLRWILAFDWWIQITWPQF